MRPGQYGVPGGRFPLPSSLLMTAVPARVAGVREVIAVCPKPEPAVMAAALEAGVTRLFRIGGAHGVAALAFGTETVPLLRIEALVGEHFDLRPGAIIRDLDLMRPIYAKTAAYGHFGRDDRDFTWEQTDKADTLRAAAGLLVDTPAS